jgi:ferredoxin--NADP+ reductase
MFKILKKEYLTSGIFLMDVYAPKVAKAAEPGQFIIVRVDEKGERIPLTICDYDKEAGTVTIVVQVVGLSTQLMDQLKEGDYFSSFAGPLGMPSELKEMPSEELHAKKIIFIAGGVGTAPVYAQVKWLHQQGIHADVIIGAKNESQLILVEAMRKISGNVYIATDDGSVGFKGLVTDCLEDLITNQHKEYDLAITIGPMIMMKFLAELTRKLNLKTIASLNTLMVDGTGMCGACRVSVGGKTRFACVEGPEFDAHLVNFDEAMRRQTMYRTEERLQNALTKDHICRLDQIIERRNK